MLKKTVLFLFLTTLLPLFGVANAIFNSDSISLKTNELHIGLRGQKAVGFYWYNGISVEYASKKICRQQLKFGINFLSSKLGSAFNSNAIPFYEIDISNSYYFRKDHKIQPLVRVNFGYTKADFGSEKFNNITNKSFLCSIETGVAYDFNFPIRIAISGGFNVITGNGLSGLGTVYPLYSQCTIAYKIF